MYQEWDSPSFTIERITELCREFFETKEFTVHINKKNEKKTLVTAENTSFHLSHTLTIERKGSKLKLSFPPISHSTVGLATLGSVVVTGRTVKYQAEKQSTLDRIEGYFWEYLDRGLAKPQSEALDNKAYHT